MKYASDTTVKAIIDETKEALTKKLDRAELVRISSAELFEMWGEGEGVTITFKTQGATQADFETTIKKGSIVPLPIEPTRAGFIFLGWWMADGLNEWNFESDIANENITLFAKWVEDVYTIVFMPGDGGTFPRLEYKKNLGDSFPTPPDVATLHIDGKSFVSWNPRLENTVTKSETYTARWSNDIHTAAFDTQGGSPQPPTQLISYGLTVRTPTEVVTRTGYTFGGWFKDKAFSEPFIFSEPLYEDITLYACWLKEGE